MNVGINSFSSDWSQLLNAYIFHQPFKSSFGEVLKVKGQSVIQLSSQIYKSKKPFLDEKEIVQICQKFFENCDPINLFNLKKLKDTFINIQNHFEDIQRKESVHLRTFSARFSRWAVNHRTIARILCVVTFGFFYQLWKKGDQINRRHQDLNECISAFEGFSLNLQEQIENYLPPQTFPDSGVRTILSYLEKSEREKLMELESVKRILEGDILKEFLTPLEVLKGIEEYKEEWKHLSCLEDYFKKYKISLYFDLDRTREFIFFHILCIFEIPWNTGLTKVTEEREQKFMKAIKLLSIHSLPPDWVIWLGLEVDKSFVIKRFKAKGRDYLNAIPRDFFKDRDFVLEMVKIDPFALSYASEEIKGDREIVLQAVLKGGYALQYASEELQKDREMMFQAVSFCGWYLEKLPEELKRDRTFVLAAVSIQGNALEFAPDEFKRDHEIVFKAVSNNGHALRYASEELKKDKKIVLAAVSDFGQALEHAAEELRKDREIVYMAVSKAGSMLRMASEELRNDADLVMKAVSNNGLALEYASEKIRNDKKIILKAILNQGTALKYASEELKKDEEVFFTAYYKNHSLFAYASDEVKSDKEIVLTAVKNNPHTFSSVSENLRNDREVVLAALEKDGYALRDASEELKKDRAIVLKAVSKNGMALQYASDALKKDREIVLAAVKETGSALMFASGELKNDREIVLKAISQDCFSIAFASEEYKLDKEAQLISMNDFYYLDTLQVFPNAVVESIFPILSEARKEFIKEDKP